MHSALSLHELSVCFPAKTALEGLSLTVAPGEVFGLLGPNGAGKSTAIDCIAGLRTPDRGTVRVLGHDPAREREAVTRRLALQPQRSSLFEFLTVAETIRLFAAFHAAPLDVDSVIARTGLEECRDRRVHALSGGEERRVLLAVALIGDPEILVLDEPSAGLDPAARRGVADIIRDLRTSGRTVLLTTHHMDEAETLCDRVGILVAGRLVATGTPGELARRRAAESRVEFTLESGADLGLLAQLVPLGRVSHVSDARGHRVTVVTADPDTVVRRITFIPGLVPREIDVHRGSLEDYFLSVADDPAREPAQDPGLDPGPDPDPDPIHRSGEQR
ncbi:ABC transporter ATP-binding protein [Leucobacter chromiireducens]|uniref:ABC transporter ATP-binding protein n=1 Tax=Leucobacter chromiireducens subsp. solipictus TaxID=398235 RepID=A0ABS1SHS3_9MICO|nr:ABC transporter ATP-binding protein [Leucobacter chromiireducens]MBL3680080.1 ABC transporter ATP-binding protein [Leucobacter chromiireducens subsp. solipictus]